MKKIQNLVHTFLLLLSLGAVAYTSSLRAEDIDIYVDNAATSGTPNVLFIIDNGSNIASTWNGGGCSAYKNTTEAPALGTGTAGGVIQCALVEAIQSLPVGALRIGIMVGNTGGFATTSPASNQPASHALCQGDGGGCLLRPLLDMDTANKDSLVNFVKSWDKNGGGTNTKFDVTINASSVASGQMMQEAWAYFNGKTGLSGKPYSKNWLQDGCQNNFIIYIGNMDKKTVNDDASGTALASAAGTAITKIKDTVKFVPPICRTIASQPAGGNASDWSENWSDEWARFMFQKDAGLSTQEGMQNVTTYTIGIIDEGSNQCTADYPALLSSMATFGGGKNFRVGNASAMTTALLSALNEVQAVNSVFSSASLPVSVNAEGSYLNQIFLGMFRPEGSGNPRWLGNLKQYQLIRNSSGQLVMGDAEGKPAITSGGTGFLAPNAVSFWTYKKTDSLPDSVGGFFVNDKKGTPVSGFDSADGEVVEKGGVAQQLRKTNLQATFTGASNTTANPRRVYTYCPQGGATCNKDLTAAENDFSDTNANIAAVAFGSAITVPVNKIVRSGTTATVTTAGNHGFSTGSNVTIRNSNESPFNVTQSVTVTSSTTFTLTNLPDYPTSPNQGTYSVSRPSTSTATYTITALSRNATATGGLANETATVTTSGTHTFVINDFVKIAGVTYNGQPSQYNKDGWRVTGVPAPNQFTISVPILPTSPATGTYKVVHNPYTSPISSIGYVKSGNVRTATANTSSVHKFHAGQTVVISGMTGNGTVYNGTWTVQSVPTAQSFTFDVPAINSNPGASGTGNATPSTAGLAPSLTRVGTTATTTARATVTSSTYFTNGDKVDVTRSGVTQNEDPYLVSNATISCPASATSITGYDCSTFTYTIPTTPEISANGFGTVSPSGGGAAILPSQMTRFGTDLNMVKVTGVVPGTFAPGTTVEISPTGTALASETAYVNTWKIDCGLDSTCASFTFGPVPLFPSLIAPGSNIQAYSGTTSPDKNSLIRWLRGEDNSGDEKGPGNGVTVRSSVHGDVLHSRPLVINYGDRRGIVVFYGSNDGVYRAVNGNASGNLTSNGVTVKPGEEIWGLILPDHYQLINRYRSNAPEVKFPSTLLPSAQPKDYFVDGPTGVYQKLNADNTIAQAIIFLTMRRGGRFIYALDVTEPARPRVVWKIDSQMAGFEELGQTWSRPRLTLLQNYTKSTTAADGTVTTTHIPVLVFGAGYDPAHDSEPPLANTMGRGVFVVDALAGTLVWSASSSCGTSTATCFQHASMKHATPADVTFVDRDQNGYTDKIYWGDLGGNLWRADVADGSTANWSAHRVAQLGCNAGECASTATPRKFFFPPAVLSVRAAGATGSYEALSIASGDREHPLRNEGDPNSAHNVEDRFFMVKDLGTTVVTGAPGTHATVDITPGTSSMFDATYTLWDGTKNGFFIKFVGAAWNDTSNTADSTKTPTKGEKGVNAPVAVNGQIFFSTNQPKDITNTCVANLGAARAYAVSPFTGKISRNELSGGGLPPSAVSGLITIVETDANGNQTSKQEKFCIGCGMSGAQTGGTNTAPCTSALENCNIGTTIPKNLKRTYWYKK